MKKVICFILTLSLLFIANETSAQKKSIVKEFYYAVNEKGEIDKKSILQKRELIFHKDRRLITINNLYDSSTTTAEPQADLYYSLSTIKCYSNNCKYDDNNRVIEYCDIQKDNNIVSHSYKYNDWGDLIEDRYVVTNKSEETKSKTVLSYEYVYLDDFNYLEADGKSFISGSKTDYSSSWVLRTIKKDGTIVQYTERKISKKR